MRSRARSLRRKNSLRPSPPLEKRELCCTKEREAGKILSSMSPGTKATTISRSGSKRLGAHVREPCGARRDLARLMQRFDEFAHGALGSGDFFEFRIRLA